MTAAGTRWREALLRAWALFHGAPDDTLAGISARMTEVHCQPGETLFTQGEHGDAVYIVAGGTLALTVDGTTLLYREPGECVGEFALIDDEPRSASAVALTEVCALRWERTDFQAALARDPAVARGILRILTAKLRQDVLSTLRMQLERERWQQDLARAKEIQAGMLPREELERPDVSVAGCCRPATEVGGDFYDYVDLGAGRLGLIIADVTGHGFYSGLFVAMAKSGLHARTAQGDAPGAMLAAMRRTQELAIQRQLLMTCCYVVLDRNAGTLTYANAGHPYPLLARRGGGALERLDALDPILGVLGVEEQPRFEERTLPWAPGDSLVLYSDGITEARAAGGEMFGHRRLEENVRGLAGEGAGALRDGILGAVSAHAGGVPQGDDLTLVVAVASA